MKSKSLLICLLAIFAFTLAMPVWAVEPSSILVNMAPENPAPLENTVISLKSFSANLDSILISWFINGKNVSSGIGKKSFSVTAPTIGSETSIFVSIFLPDGKIEKRIVIRPSVMVLLWQANDSYVPPFYKGKALPVADSEIKVVAMPEIKTVGGLIDSKNMTYSWKKDYNNMSEDSGYGKNFFIYINDYLENSNNIGVIASTTDQKYSSEANINIGIALPKILFYKKDNGLGTIWEQTLKDRHKIQDDEVIVAAPYFITPKDIRNPTLIFNWLINNNPINIQNFPKNLIPLRTQAGISGVSSLKLQIENKNKIFQTASKEINIEF